MGSLTDQMQIEWSLDIGAPPPRLERTQVRDKRALERILDDIERSAPEPVVAELVATSGARLGIGVAGPMSVLAFNSSPDPPYFMSLGDSAAADEDAAFFLHGRWTEFPGTALVPNAAARQAALQFLKTGNRPDNIEWQDV